MVKMVKMFDMAREFPVTDAFYEANYAPFPAVPSMNEPAIETSIGGLLRISNSRELTADEHRLLAALTNIKNVHSAIRWLGETPHTDFGFEGWDQVHGNHHHMPCGCVLRSVHDHHLRLQPERLEVHPHKPIRTCELHPVGNDHKAHFNAVLAYAVENQSAPPAK